MAEGTTRENHEAIGAVNEQFMSAFESRDAGGMAALYTTEGQLLPPQSEVVKGRQSIQQFWQGVMDLGIRKATLETVELEAHGDAAIEVGRYVLYAGGSQEADHGKYVVIWRREGGQWRLHRDIWNSSVPAPRS